nr:hypothetical protein [Microbacterium pseudoresistens]
MLGIGFACGAFAAVVTLISTGAFTSRVVNAVAHGTYTGLTPWGLALVVGGGAFIVTLLLLAMLMLAVDPAQVVKTVDRPVLYAEEPDAAGSETTGAADGAADRPTEPGDDSTAR